MSNDKRPLTERAIEIMDKLLALPDEEFKKQFENYEPAGFGEMLEHAGFLKTQYPNIITLPVAMDGRSFQITNLGTEPLIIQTSGSGTITLETSEKVTIPKKDKE